MGKHVKRTLEEKVNIVKEYKAGASITYLCKKYKISGTRTISTWNKKYDEGTLRSNKNREVFNNKQSKKILPSV